MTDTELIDKINRKLAEEFEADIGQIDVNAPLMETLELDSLDLIDVVVLVEQNFGLILKPEDFTEIRTFQHFYDFITTRVNGAERK